MIKSLAVSCLLAIAAISTATAGTSAPSGKSSQPVAMPPPAVACPGGIAYNTIEADWVHIWADEGPDADGANLELSYSPFNNVYVTGTAAVIDAEGDDIWGYTAGAGYFTPITENIDLVLEAGAIFDETENAFYARPHFRAKFGCLELHAGAKYYNYDDQQWGGFVSAYYEVAQNVDLGVSGFYTEDATSIQVGLRYKF
jgi:hypothetical protein